jgi:AcrR family transcriptional regulator
MRPSGRVGRERGRTFNEEARRTQIVTAAIETIAELDYAQTSFTQIAKRAGLSSTSLISYHFTGKSELVKQVVEQIYADIGGFLTNRLQAARNRWEFMFVLSPLRILGGTGSPANPLAIF